MVHRCRESLVHCSPRIDNGNGRIAQIAGSDTEYFLGDALGSVRQMADASGAVTLAKSYDPFGNVTTSTGNNATSYGFTGEFTESTGQVYLRARYYEPGMGRFTTRDTWGSDEKQPMSYNAWLYGYANPIGYTDPTGEYGRETHYQLTYAMILGLVGSQKSSSLYTWGYKINLADLIASWDYRVDFGLTINPGLCIPCHFATVNEADDHLNLAIHRFALQPYLFGGALHQFQDAFSHGNEGWTQFGGHIWVESYKDDIGRPESKLKDFFEGKHYDVARKIWIRSGFPVHKLDDVIKNVQGRNLLLNTRALDAWDLIDLYLRLDDTNRNDLSYLMRERMYFNFNTDKYIQNSTREFLMEGESKWYIGEYLNTLAKAKCNFLDNWFDTKMPPDSSRENKIRSLLTGKTPK